LKGVGPIAGIHPFTGVNDPFLEERMRKGFRFIDHTADVGVIVRGEDLPQLFEQAAMAFFALLTDRRRIRIVGSREIGLEATSVEELLVNWLGEFLYLFDTQGWLFRRFGIRELGHGHLRARVWGELYNEERHPVRTLIKAVTFHQLRVRQEMGIWKAQIIFDL
jgi:SHS2 domain-containing protein